MEKLKRARAALVGTATKFQEFQATMQRRKAKREQAAARRAAAKAKKAQLEHMLQVGLQSVEISADQLALFGL